MVDVLLTMYLEVFGLIVNGLLVIELISFVNDFQE